MKRTTSIEAYNEIKRSGVLSERRMQVYQILYKYGPMTAAQVVDIARTKLKVSNSGNFGTRLSELRRMGCVDEIKEAACPLTGRKVIWWDVNGKIPTKLKRKKTAKQSNRDAANLFEMILKRPNCIVTKARIKEWLNERRE